MTVLHSADLTRRLNDFLERRQPPRGFAQNDQRKVDQMEAYIRILSRFAPRNDTINDWWGDFLSALSEVSETWAWPSEGDVVKACKAVSKAAKRADAPEWQIDPLAVAEKRIEADEPISDGWLWGKSALLLISRVGMDAVAKRRDRHASHLAKLYGADEARRMLLGLVDRHEAAIRSASAERDERSQPRHVDLKIKSVADLLGPGPQYVPYRQHAAE